MCANVLRLASTVSHGPTLAESSWSERATLGLLYATSTGSGTAPSRLIMSSLSSAGSSALGTRSATVSSLDVACWHEDTAGPGIVTTRCRLHPGEVEYGESQVDVHLAPEFLVVPAQAGVHAAAAAVPPGDLDAQFSLADPARSAQPGTHRAGGRAERSRALRQQAVDELVRPGGHPVFNMAHRVVRVSWQGLDPVVGQDRVDQPARAARIRPLQVDLGGDAPGTVGGPARVRGLLPGGQPGDGSRGPLVEEVVPVRQVHPWSLADRAGHRVP